MVLGVSLFSNASFAGGDRDGAFKEGDNIVSIGYGFPNLNKSLFKAFDTYTEFKVTGIGPLHLKAEHAITDNFGIGLSINGVSSTMSYKDASYSYKYAWTSVKFNARFNYHFVSSETFDPYIGIGAGYGFASGKWSGTGTSNTTIKNPLAIGFEGTAGCRYYFSPNIGAYAEIGLAKSVMQAGLCFKF